MKNTKKQAFFTSTLAEILFPVEMIDVTEKRYDESNSDCQFDIVATIDGRTRKLQSCSDVYTLTPNSEIYPEIERMFNESGIPFKALYNHINFSKFYGQYQLLDEKFVVNGKVLSLVITVVHSYDGWVNYSFFAGLVGDIDKDIKKSVPVIDQDFFKGGKHTKKSLESIADLFANIGAIIEQKDAIKAALTALTTTKVENYSQTVDKVFKLAGLSDGHVTKDTQTGKNKVAVLGKALGAKTNWDVYVAFNEGFVYSDLNKQAPHKRAELDLKIMNILTGNLN